MHRPNLKQMVIHLHKMNQDLNQNWNLRNANYDKEILLATILQKYDEFPVLQTNPILFKYQCDIWWDKHYRTFEKWLSAFDLNYDPLINNWRKETREFTENTVGAEYNRFNNKDNITNHHIGDSFSNEDFSNEYEDHDVSNEVFDGDTTDRHTQSSKGDTTTTNIKDGSSNKGTTDDKTTNTASDVTVDIKAANFSNEHSGGVEGTFQTAAGDLKLSEQSDTRKTENTVSAYNSSVYEPSSQDEVKGDMGTAGRNTSSTHTYGTGDDNETTEHTDNTEDILYNELNSGNEQTKNNMAEYSNGTDDHTTDYKDDKNGSNQNNRQTTSNDKFINNSKGDHSGDSQKKNDVEHHYVENNFHEGNLSQMTAQHMLTEEIRVQLFSIYDQISELFVDENCICIWTNDNRRCCW